MRKRHKLHAFRFTSKVVEGLTCRLALKRFRDFHQHNHQLFDGQHIRLSVVHEEKLYKKVTALKILVKPCNRKIFLWDHSERTFIRVADMLKIFSCRNCFKVLQKLCDEVNKDIPVLKTVCWPNEEVNNDVLGKYLNPLDIGVESSAKSSTALSAMWSV